MEKFSSTEWNDLTENLRGLGKQLEAYEKQVINLIASDNACPHSLSNAPVYSGNIIQEGLVGRRPFAGAQLHDAFERSAANIACKVFNAEHANIQPHSCSQANQAVYHALLNPGDTVLSLGFQAGGHLTHGLKQNFSGSHYKFFHYGVTVEGLIDYDSAQALAFEKSPKLIVCGSSSYPRLYDVMRLRKIADSVGAQLMLDLSHEAGLIAGQALPNIIDFADVVTMSTDKTLRGPFGGIILTKLNLADKIDRAVHPGTQSSFPVRKIAITAQALALTQTEAYKIYARDVIVNAKTLANSFPAEYLFTGGTDKHYIVLDVMGLFNITGAEAERKLEEIGILSSRQSGPKDKSKKMSEAGSLRLGTAWATSRGYDAVDFVEIATLIKKALISDKGMKSSLVRHVEALVNKRRPNDVWAEGLGGASYE